MGLNIPAIIDYGALRLDGSKVMTGALDMGSQNIDNVDRLTLVDGAENAYLEQDSNWTKFYSNTGFGFKLDGHVLLGDDAVYWKPGLNAYTLALEGSTPSIFQKCVRTSGTGLAFNLFELHLENDTTTVEVGNVGFFGNVVLGGTPTAEYLWMGCSSGFAYDNATLKVSVDNRVGIAVSGATSPTEALDVNGNVHLTTDEDKMLLGAGKDLELYHNADVSYVNHSISTGGLKIQHNGTTRIETDNTGIGFFAVSPVAKQTGFAVVTTTVEVRDAVNAIRTILNNYGLTTVV